MAHPQPFPVILLAVGSGNWSLVSGPNSPIITTPANPVSTVTGMTQGLYLFTWTISNGSCASSGDSVRITIYDPPTVADAGADQVLCNTPLATLAGNSPVNGSADWTLISGSEYSFDYGSVKSHYFSNRHDYRSIYI